MQTDAAKEFFGRTVKTAQATSKCVSCLGVATKLTFKTPEAYQEYREIGLCQKCQDGLNKIAK